MRPAIDGRFPGWLRCRRLVDGYPNFARRLGVFDATMLVMGGIVGAGIFVNPAEVARHVSTPLLIVGVWVAGGLVALAASFVYAELAARRPEVGGQYAYLRDAYGPMPAFLYGWALLLVIQSGGMAAVAITFSIAQILSADPLAGNQMELDAIAAVVIGGASLYGGRGSIIGTLIGVLIMVMIRNGLNLMGVSPFWQGTAIGSIIILALLAERLINWRSAR